MRAQRPLVEVGAGHLELVADLGRLVEHLLAAERVAQAVLDHRVERLDVAHAEALARAGQQVRRLRHRLHAAADGELDVTGADGLVDHPDGAHARRAHLVDRLRGDLDRDPGVDLRLARRDLALAGLEHACPSRRARPARARRRRAGAPRGSLRRPDAWPGASTGPRPACRSACGRCSGSRFEACRPSLLSARACDVTATTDAPTATDADTIAVGVFEDEGDRARPRRRAAGAGGLRRGQARAAQARGDARRRAALHRRRARRARRTSTPSGRAWPPRASLGRAKELGTKTLCWEVPHHVSDAHAGALVEGTLLAAYTLPRVQERRRRRRRRSRPLILSAHHDVSAPAALRGDGRGGRQRRPRPAEPPGQRPHAGGAGRARAGARGRDRRRARPRRRSRRRAWARSPPSRAGSDDEPRLITIRYEPAGRHRPAARLRRQGGDVRLRRHLDQARGEDARDEVRHVGRRGRAGGRRRDRPRSGCPCASRA